MLDARAARGARRPGRGHRLRGRGRGHGAAGEDGGFSFGELVPGSYTLAVSAEGHRPTALPVEVVTGTPNWYEVQLAPGARITRTVRTADGRPLDDARVTLLDPAGNVVGTATTGLTASTASPTSTAASTP